MPDLQLCSAHLHQNIFNRAGRNQQKHAEIHIHHIIKAQASDHTPNINLQHLYLEKKNPKQNIEICLNSGSNIPPSQKPVNRHYVDLTQGLIIPTWRSAINLSFMMLNCPQNSLISMTSSHILWFLTVHTCNL